MVSCDKIKKKLKQSRSLANWKLHIAAVVLSVFALVAIIRLNLERELKDKTSIVPPYTLDRQRLRENLRFLTKYPHSAGSAGDKRIAKWIKEMWIGQGIDVKSYDYNTLLSFPDMDDPSTVSLLDGSGNVLFTSQVYETDLTPNQAPTTDRMPPFNAFSPSGDIESGIIYVNYGRVEDFKLLRDHYGINFTGNIVIARYGEMFRGVKVAAASDFGASGIILYADPADFVLTSSGKLYPNDWWLPHTGIQQGCILPHGGEMQTPGYPATDYAYRIPEDELQFPAIPCHCMSYGDALVLLQNLSGEQVPPDWAGTLPGLIYRIGPHYFDKDWKVRLHVRTHSKVVKTSNVIGYIKGSVEQDRYVILGVHRDAWGYGAIDPGIGSAILLEIATTVSDLVEKGWRPRRSIVFCSWGAEEYGLLGSIEWVEHFLPILRQRAVAYLNLDIPMVGNFTLKASGMPLLHDLMYSAAKNVDTPNSPGHSLYSEWLARSPEVFSRGNGDIPRIQNLGSGSNFDPFMTLVGVSSVDVSYLSSKGESMHLYPLYHSIYDTFYAVDTFLDPQYKYSTAVGSYMMEILLHLTSEHVLPMNAQTYAHTIKEMLGTFQETYGDVFIDNNIDLSNLNLAVDQLNHVAAGFMTRLGGTSKTDVYTIRAMNDQLMLMERAFIDTVGLPKRKHYKHILYAPNSQDLYSGVTFPGLDDILFNYPDEECWNLVREHLAAITYAMDLAASSLSAPTNI